jgi:8-oxo-dGTP pyrophosphatase MutT (NUDIX family)
MLGKVTAFVVRTTPHGTELLLFEHPHAGVQLPAGTIELGETPEAAALREAREETGLSAFTGLESLGARDELLPPDMRVMLRTTALFTRPASDHTYGVQIRSGITVRVERAVAGFAQITYEEQHADGGHPYVSYALTGWVPTDVLAPGWRRHFFLLRYDEPTPARWQVETDHHQFTLFWTRLHALPALWRSQDAWLEMLPPTLAGERRNGSRAVASQ